MKKVLIGNCEYCCSRTPEEKNIKCLGKLERGRGNKPEMVCFSKAILAMAVTPVLQCAATLGLALRAKGEKNGALVRE